MKHAHQIKTVAPGSIAEELELEPGDKILQINGQDIEDVLDYRFYIQNEEIDMVVQKKDGSEVEWEFDKDFYEDLGIEFESGLMSDYRSCTNKCIFCFIDQMPPGMRDTLYFKDDDARLSFLQGNYITLTNMKEHDLSRIIKYHLSPINISVQTTNPELRVNDGAELERSIRDLAGLYPQMQSMSVVPVGLSKYREGLYPLEPLTKEDAENALDIIGRFQNEMYERFGTHFVHASDEFYLLANRPLPPEEVYDGYVQLENGVGMLRLLIEETDYALEALSGDERANTLSLATGKLAYPFLKDIAAKVHEKFPNVNITVYEILNDFFGHGVTVSGLITGQDLIKQLTGKPLGEALLLPANMFRSNEEVFLDDLTKQDVEKALQVPINIVKSDGQELIRAMLMEESEETKQLHSPYEL